MARLPRLYAPGCAQHIIQRGNNRDACFFSDKDYAVYLDTLKEYAKQYCVEIHAFVLKTNHVHLLITPQSKTGVSKMMQSLGRYYVRYVNNTYKRTGTLWEGRYKSTLVDSERYLLTIYRYIELNPVRASMVETAGDYPWSSFQSNALGKDVELITPHALYEGLGDDKVSRQTAYLALFKGRMGKETLKKIRDSTNKSWVLGDEKFKQHTQLMANRRLESLGLGGDRKSEFYRMGKQK
jgi:putative transposase